MMMDGVRFESNDSTSKSQEMEPAALKVDSCLAQIFYQLHNNFKSWWSCCKKFSASMSDFTRM